MRNYPAPITLEPGDISEVTAENTRIMVVETSDMIEPAAIAIRPMIRAYSTMSWPCVSLHTRAFKIS